MFPGISVPAEGLPSFLAGELWAVKVPGNPAPIAVSLFAFGTKITDYQVIYVILLIYAPFFFFVMIYMKVGSTTMSSTEALKAGLRGKALKIAHYYGDVLW